MRCSSMGPHFSTLNSIAITVFPLSVFFYCILSKSLPELEGPAQMSLPPRRLAFGPRGGRKPVCSRLSSCFYFTCNSFKCLFGWTIHLGPLCWIWQVGLHFINEIMTIIESVALDNVMLNRWNSTEANTKQHSFGSRMLRLQIHFPAFIGS